jgi:folate-binding protein YgfZ
LKAFHIKTMSTAALTHRALLSVSGPDWASFLKGLCTAHIDDLADEVSRGELHRLHYGAFLRPQGKMIADCLLHAVSADEIWLDAPLDVRDELFAKLNMYKLRARVSIARRDEAVVAAMNALPDGFMSDPRSLITGGVYGRAYGVGGGDGDWRSFRYALGLAEGGEDFGADDLYAIDANLDALNAIDFHKGCYVGQELTSRMKRRGQIKNRILPLRHEGRLNKAAEVLVGERKIGEVLSGGDGASLGVMRLDRLAGEATCDGVKVEVIIPDWLKDLIPETTDGH